MRANPKSEILNPKQYRMTKIQEYLRFDDLDLEFVWDFAHPSFVQSGGTKGG
jgi:hypothetical protein